MKPDNLLKTAEALFKTKLMPTQVSILMYLLEGDKPKQLATIASKIDLTVNGTVYHIDKFVKLGHVQREGKSVRLTPKGRVYAKSLAVKVEMGNAA